VKFKPDPSFRYTSSADTDLRKTFARIREGLRQGSGTTVYAPAHVALVAMTTTQSSRIEASESHRHKQ